MDMVTLGGTGLRASAMGLGCSKLGSLAARQTPRRARQIVAAALDGGVRLFDTADAYGAGTSESILGRELAGRDDVVVATKVGYLFDDRTTAGGAARAAVGTVSRRVRRSRSTAYAAQDFSPAYVRDAVAASLRRLRRSRIDLLQFHGPPPPDGTDLPGVVAELITAGDVANFGIGAESIESAAAWLAVDGLATVQLPFGVLDPQATTIVMPEARRRGVAVIARGVLGGGLLGAHATGGTAHLDAPRLERVRQLDALARAQGVDVLQLAVWYAAGADWVDAYLLGASNTTQLHAALRMAASTPDGSVLAEIARIVDESPA